jgi:molecular chaperone GrpE
VSKKAEQQEATEAAMNPEIEENEVIEEVQEEMESASTYTVEGEELEQLRKQADENYQRYLRTQADFDNFRRRARQEKEDLAKYASQKLVESLVPIIDNFDRALQSSKETQDFDGLVKGIDMVFRQFEGVLQTEGVKQIESVGQPFNPEFHQAIMQVETDEYEEGIVVEELQKGYMLNDRVIRPAMVKVSM